MPPCTLCLLLRSPEQPVGVVRFYYLTDGTTRTVCDMHRDYIRHIARRNFSGLLGDAAYNVAVARVREEAAHEAAPTTCSCQEGCCSCLEHSVCVSCSCCLSCGIESPCDDCMYCMECCTCSHNALPSIQFTSIPLHNNCPDCSIDFGACSCLHP